MTVFRGQGRPLYERCNSLQHSSVQLWHFESNVAISLIFWSRFERTTSVMIVTDCIGSCKSNYHTITATITPYPYNRLIQFVVWVFEDKVFCGKYIKFHENTEHLNSNYIARNTNGVRLNAIEHLRNI